MYKCFKTLKPIQNSNLHLKGVKLKSMRLQKFLIAGGNSTLLVWGCPASGKSGLIKKYLGEVEQIGFVETKDNLPFLNMMGGELCINGTIALASQCKEKGKLFTSGITSPVFYQNSRRATSIGLAIKYKRTKNVVLLEGIGYIYLKKKINNKKQYLKNLCQEYNLPAFGIIYYEKGKIVPFVYVKGTDSLFAETACGSGSIAFSILTRRINIVQPTGKIIVVNNNGNSFVLNAQVTNVT